MNRILLLIFLFVFVFPVCLPSQSLGPKRVKKLKDATVRVLVDGMPTGTAFFVNKEGWLATCWHVVESAIVQKLPLEIEFIDGEVVEVGFSTGLLENYTKQAIMIDFALLKPLTNPKTKFSYFNIGDFRSTLEGSAIYSNGYPLGIEQNFISTGTLSTKWSEKVPYFLPSKENADSMVLVDSMYRDVAWLDLTMNRGNSGGPIVKFGETPEQDSVIGVATFLLNPYGNQAQQIVDYINTIPPNPSAMGGLNWNEINRLYAGAISNNSIGVSGCVSINYFLETSK